MQIIQPVNLHGGHHGLLRALAISIVFHLLLLWPAATAWRATDPAVPMVASLRPSAAPVAPVSVAASPPKPTTIERADRQAPPAPPESPPVPAERAEPRVADTVGSTAAFAPGSETVPAPPTPDPRPAAASVLPPSPGLDADGLRSYRLGLAREARRHKRYPARAEEARWEGTAVLRVSVAGTSAPAVQLAKSSGYAVLDEAALAMLRLALPATPIPAPLQGRDFSVELPIVFELPQ